MLEHVLVIAQKELLDSVRDVRSLLSSLLYCLMGPGVVFMVSLTMNDKSAIAAERSVLIGMMSVFTLVSAFVGGMNVGMDVLAGERERRSLLPLLMNAVARRDVLLGKWIAVSCFSAAGVIITLAGFVVVFAAAGFEGSGNPAYFILLPAFGLVPLALLAAALELCLSAVCRTVKEAHTYLSMLAFVPMACGMLLVFNRNAAYGWAHFLPVAGQQWQLERWARGGDIPLLQALVLFVSTSILAICALSLTANLMKRDDVIYGS
ncbi:MAG: ABC transporter permease subunit [Bryobacteraceae bacterium]|nr:ABC transporter permease subunit [Bryobacteraceae bacterium]